MFSGISAVLTAVENRVRPLVGFLKRVAVVFLVVFVATSVLPTKLSFYGRLSSANWFGNSVSDVLLRWSESYLLPKGETVIIVAPFDAFTVLMEIGAALGIIAATTYAVAAAVRYAWPGLKARERYWARRLILLVPGLFVLGSAVGLYLLPYLYAWSYDLAFSVGASPTVSLTEFVATSIVFVLSVGAGFEIPSIAAGLAAAGILRSTTMKTYWRHAVLGCFVLALFISPGVGGGVIEIPLGFGFSGLFALAYAIVKRVEATDPQRGDAVSRSPA